ncbi:MAG: methylornithine synthase PylB [Methanohalobium sp.]|uniref:methylornithine synthase PylB n=1 Tax=Methanohalobium sp. TaxID=2837493 RepID=UPI0039783DCA
MLKNMDNNDLNEFIQDIINGRSLSGSEIEYLLTTNDRKEIDKLHQISRKVRDKFTGNRVFLYSFIYFSTYCKNECSFCYYNRLNNIHRYRLSNDEILNICSSFKDKHIHMIDLTMGEDPYYHNNPQLLVDMVKNVKKELNLPIMVSPGVVDNDTLNKLHESGANFLALYQETYDKELYENMRVGQSFEDRINARRFAKSIGFYVEDGILSGIESNTKSIIKSLRGMEDNNPDMVRAMTFIPQEGTPLENQGQYSSEQELRIIAILRLMFPDKLIPASLDIEGINGMVKRLNAGANVVTSIIPSNTTLEGVVNYDRDLEERTRNVENVLSRLKTMGMEPAKQSEFNQIIGL